MAFRQSGADSSPVRNGLGTIWGESCQRGAVEVLLCLRAVWQAVPAPVPEVAGLSVRQRREFRRVVFLLPLQDRDVRDEDAFAIPGTRLIPVTVDSPRAGPIPEWWFARAGAGDCGRQGELASGGGAAGRLAEEERWPFPHGEEADRFVAIGDRAEWNGRRPSRPALWTPRWGRGRRFRAEAVFFFRAFIVFDRPVPDILDHIDGCDVEPFTKQGESPLLGPAGDIPAPPFEFATENVVKNLFEDLGLFLGIIGSRHQVQRLPDLFQVGKAGIAGGAGIDPVEIRLLRANQKATAVEHRE